MTCVIVNDACCLIDLDKGGLLDVICALPYRLVVPLPVRESELLRISDSQWRQLDGAGLVTYDLPPDEVGLALDLKERRPALSANDCLCYVTTVVHSGILLTDDALLRKIASADGLRVHGVLWLVDELDKAGVCPRKLLVEALSLWRADATVFLPQQEIADRLTRLAGLAV